MIYDNDKLNEIYRDTWPNLGWAIKDRQNVQKPTESEPKNGNPTGPT